MKTPLTKQQNAICKSCGETFDLTLGHECPGIRSVTSKLRTIEPFSSPDGIRAEVEFHKLGGSGCVVVTSDTPGFEQEEVVLSAREAHDLMLWLQCALSLTGRSESENIGAKRYKLTTGHSDDAGLGGEGWVVRMSDHFPSFDTAQKWVKSEDYEALRQRFENACARVSELESAPETKAQPIRWGGTDEELRQVLREFNEGKLTPERFEEWLKGSPEETAAPETSEVERLKRLLRRVLGGRECNYNMTEALARDIDRALSVPSAQETSAPFGVCSKCKQPITSAHNISGCPAEKASGERVCQCATYCMANAGMKWDPPVKCRGLTGTDPGAHVRFK